MAKKKTNKTVNIDETKLLFGFKVGKDGKPYNPNAKKGKKKK